MKQQIQNKEIPEGWKEDLLLKITEKVSDRNHVTPKYVEMGVPLISPRDFLEDNGVDFNTEKFISEEDYLEDYKKVDFREKDILLSRIGTIGKVRILTENRKFMALHSIVQIRSNERVVPLFLFYALQSFEVQNQIKRGVKSIGTPDLGIDKIRNLIISYPESKEEQNLIVQEIEKQFTRLDEAVKSLKAVKEKLEIYRKAVLKNSFEIKEGWEGKELGKLVNTRKEKSNPQKLKEQRYIGMAHVQSNNGRIIEEHFAGEMKASSANFYKGDVLYGRLRPYLNKVVDAEFNGLGSTEFIILIPEKDVFYKFIGWRLRNKDFVDYANSLNNGDRPRVKFTQISKFRIYIPKSLSEQQLIVQSIESKFSVIDKIEQVVEASLEKAEKLRKSILKSAFEGKLVKKDEINV